MPATTPHALALADVPLDAGAAIVRALAPRDWPSLRNSCTWGRDAVRRATMGLRVDISQDGDLGRAPPTAALPFVRTVRACLHKPRDAGGILVALKDELQGGFLAWLPPAAELRVEVRCERAALDVGVIAALVDAGVMARASALHLRADDATCSDTSCLGTAARLPKSVAVDAEIKCVTGRGGDLALGLLSAWRLRSLRVIAAGQRSPAGSWSHLPGAAPTLASLDLADGVSLADALGAPRRGGGFTVWPALTSLVLRGPRARPFLAAWPRSAAPALTSVRVTDSWDQREPTPVRAWGRP